jgi:endonuclease G
MTNERAMAQSFSLANMMPQARQNNQGIWAKNVEEPTRQYVKRIDGDLYVFTGSTGKIGSIGTGQVTIPEHLFKLVYEPSKNTAWAYWVANTNDATMSPPITYQDLKEKTGIDFHLPADVAPLHGKKSNQASQTQQPSVGGWYPIFFDGYSSSKVQEILASIKAGKVSSIQIQYDRNTELAKKLSLDIQSQTALHVGLSQNSPPESKTVTYERNRVTAIIRTK